MTKCLKSNIFKHARKRSFQAKAQGLPLNVIVIAALVLVILVVLIIIFQNRMGKWGKGLDESATDFTKKCEIPGTSRRCVNTLGECPEDKGSVVSGSYSDCEAKYGTSHVCCEF